MFRLRSQTVDIAERLRTSKDGRYRQQTFLGFHAGGDPYPVLVPDSFWESGFWILGGARTGKTSRVLASLIYQRITRNDCPVVVIDLKGDRALFQLVRRLAESLSRQFIHYSNVPQFSTHLYNPLDQGFLDNLSRTAISESIATSTNLLHGPGYGKQHFTLESLEKLVLALEGKPSASKWLPAGKGGRAKSFLELRRNVVDVIKQRKEHRSAASLTMMLQQLASVFTLNGGCCDLYPASALAHSFQVQSLLCKSQNGTFPVLYCYLRVESEPMIGPVSAKFVLNQMKTSMQNEHDNVQLGTRIESVPNVACFVDEWQHVADDAFRNMLEQGASMGFQFVLANQDVSQLSITDRDYLQTVWENCGNKIILSSRDPRFQEWLMKVSGEKPIHNVSYLVSGTNLGRGRITSEYSYDGLYQVAEVPGPRFERNHIIDMSDTPGRAMFIPAGSDSLAQYGGYPIMIDIPFLLSREEFEELQKSQWPGPTPATVVPADYRTRWEEFLASQR